MKKLCTLLVLVLIGQHNLFSQCVEIPKNRVLLVGDSWAAFMNGDLTITNGLRNMGHSNKKYTSSLSIAENGAETWDFMSGPKLDDIVNIINANPDINIVHLSIGGNDLLGDWNVSFTDEQTDSLTSEVKDRLLTIIDFLQNTRPGMRVFWAGYTYPNFGEVIEDVAPFQTSHPFYSTWNDMGQPDFATINGILNEVSDSMTYIAANDPQLDFVPAQGILQYQYGQTSPLGVAPGGTYAPFEAPLPVGFPDYPSPKSSMRLYAGIFTDCFHLTPEAYLTMFTYQAQKFYQKFFMDDKYILSDGGANDGSVSSSGDVSNSLQLGQFGGSEYATVVSFDTQVMADTTVSSASIFLRRESLSGTNPFSGASVHVKMKSGNFGSASMVEAEDFTAEGDADDNVCRFGSDQQNGHWVRIDLSADIVASINNQDKSQFIITVPGSTGGLMTFSDASDPEHAPILNLKYGPSPNSVNEHSASKELPVYPIPTVGPLTIDASNARIQFVEVLSVLGNVVLKPSVSNNSIDISSLTNGSYVLRITTDEGISTKRIIKR